MLSKLFAKLHWSSWLWLFLAMIATSYALIPSNLFFVHDYTHGARIAEMLRALQDGHFPVHWSGNFGYGYGMPLFLFYAPLPYYVGAFFSWIGFSLISAIKLMYLISNLGTLIGGYFLGNKLFKSEWAKVSLAVILLLSPYRAVNLYIRGALSEAWGIMFLPWLFAGVIGLIQKKDKKSWLLLAFSYAGLILSHNLTALMGTVGVAIFGLGYILTEKVKDRKAFFISRIKSLISASLTGIGLSSFYLIPAFIEKDFTIIKKIFSGYFHYSQHHLYIRQFFDFSWKYGGSSWGPDDGLSFFFGWSQWIGLIAFGLIIGWWIIKLSKKKGFWQKIISFFHHDSEDKLKKQLWLGSISIMTFSVAIFFTLKRSQFIWDNIKLFQFIQFPWRWLSISLIALAILVGVVVEIISLLLKNRTHVKVIAALIIGVALLTSYQTFRPESYFEGDNNLSYGDAERIQTNMSVVLPDYIPTGFNTQLKPSPDLIIKGELSEMDIRVNRTHQKLIQTDFKKDHRIILGIANFPGWSVELDGEKYELSTTKDGLIQIKVPAGKHNVGVIFNNTPVRNIANSITLITLAYIIWEFGFMTRKKS